MFVIREARSRDRLSVLALAKRLDSYNLPADPKTITAVIRASRSSFRSRRGLGDRGIYLFLIEDASSRRVIGCSLIIARHGTPALPHLAFRIGTETKRSRTLRKRVTHHTLRLEMNRRGYTELGGLVVLPRFRHRKEKLGKQLSYVRFAYMARFPGRFSKKLLVEFRPRMDLGRGNHLWRTLGQRFTGLSYRAADRLSATNKEFILSLFPREKIYCDFLSEPAMRDLHVPEEDVGRALRMLEKNGFRYLNQVDPFDGGPHYGADRDRVPLIRRTHFWTFREGNINIRLRSPDAIVSTTDRKGFRAMLTPFRRRKSELMLPKEAATLLELRDGQAVAVTPFRIGGGPA